MRIVCPSCHAGYEVPSERLAPGRMVRCAACGGAWAPVADAAEIDTPAAMPTAPAEPPVPAAAPVIQPQPEPKPIEPTPAMTETPAAVLAAGEPAAMISQPPRVNVDRLGLMGWALTAVVLVAAGWGAVAWRSEIMRAWPHSERAYAAIGLR